MNTWTVAKLGELCGITTGGTPPRSRADFFGGGIPWVKIGDMLQGRISSTEETISRSALKGSSAKLLQPGTVLISIFATIGRTAVLDVEAATNQAIAGVTPRDHCILTPRYLRQYLDYVAIALEKQARGVAQVNINSTILKSLSIPLPSLAEQLRITGVLERCDALRAKRREAIACLDILTQSIFLDMFSGDCTYDFIETTVADVADARRGAIRTGPFGSQLLHSEFRSSGVAVLGIDNAVDNEFKWGKPRYITMAKYRTLERYTVHPGDVLITIMGTCGRCAIVPDDIPLAINTKHLCCISLNRNKCLPEFLQAYFLIHPIARNYLLKTAKGAVMDGLNMGLIKEMPLRLPVAHLQQVFVDCAAVVTEQRLKYSSSLAGLDALFASLQHRAFRGQL